MVERILKSDYDVPGPIVEKTLPEYYLERAKYHAARGKSYWLVDGLTDEKRYYSKFDEETRRIASAFHKLGLQKGDVVIFMIRDLVKSYILLTGVWRGNGVMRASYPDDDAETIFARVVESNVKFLVCEEDSVKLCSEVALKAAWKVNVITVNRTSNADIPSLQQFLEEDDGIACPEILVTEDDPAIILCTSGTTGMPKGAVHTHKSFLYQNRCLEPGPFLEHKLNLAATKATHISGTTLGLVFLACGKTGLVVSNLTVDNIFYAAEKYKPGYVFAFPTFLVAIANAHGNGRDFSSIEVIYTAGVSVTPAIRESLSKLPGLKDTVVAYGMTEVLICTTSAVLKDDSEKDGVLGIRDLPDFSVGKICPGTQIQIRDLASDEILGANQTGEICVRSPASFQSYLNNPKATQEAFLDGYFRTGDVGYFDNNGFIYIVDRIKEIFKYFHNHISPTELENVIGKHPKVAEVCVVGVPNEGGHVPRAFVRVNDTSIERNQLSQYIATFANEKLASYKQLRGGVVIIDELPKGKTGKVSRKLLEEYK